MTQVDKIKKLGDVMSKYFTDVKVGFDFWEDTHVGVLVTIGKSTIQIVPDGDTDDISVMFTEKGRIFPCDEVVKEGEYDFFGEFLSTATKEYSFK